MKTAFSIIVFFVCFSFSSVNLFSQSPPTWSHVGEPGAVECTGGGGNVMAMCTLGADMYVTGWFASIDNVAAAKVAKYNGTTWSALGTGITAGGNINGECICAYGGNIYVGGSFTTVGGVACANIAMWNVGTSTWSAVGAGGGITGVCRALYVYGGELYAMGGTAGFSIPGVANTTGIAKWNGAVWSAVGAGLNGIAGVSPALYQFGADLWVGGTFTSAQDIAATPIADTRNLAKWNGANWSACVPATDLGPNGAVHDMTTYAGNLIVVGAFTRIRNSVITVNYKTAKWDGAVWTNPPFADIPSAADPVVAIYCCAIYQTNLYVAGNFVTFSGTAGMNYVARMGISNTWTTVGTSPLDAGVYSMHVYGGNIYVGGDFGYSATICDAAQVVPEHMAKIAAFALPVELISFSGSCNDKNTVKLNWSTASESNNDYFTIERMNSYGEGWAVVGKVNGSGNSSTIRNYEFIDALLPSPGGEGSGVRYYRLRQTDFNGTSEEFPVTSVNLSCEKGSLTILPNPSLGIFSVSGLMPDADISVYNILGEKIFSKSADAKFITIDISAKPKGIYFLKTISGNKVGTEKIILQ